MRPPPKKRTNRNVKAVSRIQGRRLYKVFLPGMLSPYGATLKWPVPKGSRKGAWKVHQGPMVMCARGLHVLVGAGEVRRFVHSSSRIFCVPIDRLHVYRVEVAGIHETRRRSNSLATAVYAPYGKAVVSHVRLVKKIKFGTSEWNRVWAEPG